MLWLLLELDVDFPPQRVELYGMVVLLSVMSMSQGFLFVCFGQTYVRIGYCFKKTMYHLI